MFKAGLGILAIACLSCFGQDVDYVEGVFELYDTNTDYAISLAELEAVQQELELAVEQASDEEAHARLQEKYQPLLDAETWLRADIDDDQSLGKGELVEYLWLRDFHEAPPPSMTDCRYLAQLEVRDAFEPLLEVLDLNGDQLLSKAEAEEALASGAADVFSQIDADGNGNVDREEFEEYSYRELLLLYELDDSSEEAPD